MVGRTTPRRTRRRSRDEGDGDFEKGGSLADGPQPRRSSRRRSRSDPAEASESEAEAGAMRDTQAAVAGVDTVSESEVRKSEESEEDSENVQEEESSANDRDDEESEEELPAELARAARIGARAAVEAMRLEAMAQDPRFSDHAIFQRALDKGFRTTAPEVAVPKEHRRSEAAAAKRAAAMPSARGAGYAANATERRAAMLQAKKDLGVGRKWHNFVGREVDPELKQEISALRMRGYVDPKRFYKNAGVQQPTAVQMGTVVEGRGEFFTSRIPKKKRARTFVDELLADESVKSYTKKKLVERMEEKNKHKKNRRKRLQNRRAPVWAKQ